MHTNITGLQKLCESHKVAKMYAFGSVCSDRFDAKSDIDLLITFKRMSYASYADNYFDLKEKLEKLFSREVDLVSEHTIKNPFLAKTINATKTLIYEG